MALRHVLRPDLALLGGDAERRIRGAVAFVSVSSLDDLEEEPLAVVAAVELEVFAPIVAIIEDVFRPHPVGEIGVETEAGFEVAIVVWRDRQRLEAPRPQGIGRGENVITGEGNMLHARAEAFRDEVP